MRSPAESISALVQTLVPQTRRDDHLRRDLVEDATAILNSHIGQSRQQDTGHLTTVIKRQLSPTDSLRFSNLVARLQDQPVLSKKHSALLFLHSLSSSLSAPPAFLPSLISPPSSRHKTSTPIPTQPQNQHPTHPQVPLQLTNAQLLAQHRARSGKHHLAEHLLLRDALYLLQGISGRYIHFSDEQDTLVFTDDPQCFIPAPTRTLIHRLAELGHLYKRVSAWVRERQVQSGIGMIEQSLAHHIQTQLTEYYRLVAVLESQMSRATSGDDSVRQSETGLTLRRLEVWIDEWRLRMRMMSVCVEGCRDAHGGALVSLIHAYTDTGDPFIRKFTDQLLEEVSKPFFSTLHSWLFSGDLHDPFSEFFVALAPELAHLQNVHPSVIGGALDGGFGDKQEGFGGEENIVREGGLRLWQDKYRFTKEMLPSFVGETFGKKIFSTGKSLNFIRYSCHDSDWIEIRNGLNVTGPTLKYSDISGLERSIDSAYRAASQRLFTVFFEKFKLLEHLKALKQYLLLGHGDFADGLMEALAPSLSRPANALFRHNLTTTLEAAIQSSNARFDPPDVLRRLDARMLEYSHGEIGWDVFTLEYKVDQPLDTVVDAQAMVKYLRIFNHLWKMKRTESTLGRGWLRITAGAKSFLRLSELRNEWHQARIVTAEMLHFVRALQAYCHLEVIECSWTVLLDFINKKEGDLDALIEAHQVYLDRMVRKILLLYPKAGKEEHLLIQVREIFHIILQYREATDNFYNYCLAEAARRDHARDSERGLITTAPTALPTSGSGSADNLPRILRRIKDYGGAFSERAQAIVHALQAHPDLDCRFLGIRMSFSDFYKTKKEKEKEAAAVIGGGGIVTAPPSTRG